MGIVRSLPRFRQARARVELLRGREPRAGGQYRTTSAPRA